MKKLTIAENCLKYGVGAFNIDACRVGSEVIRTFNPNGPNRNPKQDIIKLVGNNSADTYHTGRFPSNFILQHTADCELLGYEEEEVNNSRQNNSSLQTAHGQTKNRVENNTPYNTTIQKWNCSPKCPCKLLDEQAPNTGAMAVVPEKERTNKKTNCYGEYQNRGNKNQKLDGLGGASRFFKQFESE